MTWTALSDTWSDREDVLKVGRSARQLLVEALIWCNRQETDGRLPQRLLRRISDSDDLDRDVAELLDAGLFADLGNGSYQVDWTDQKTHEELTASRERKAENERKYRRRGQLHDAGDHSECTTRCPVVRSTRDRPRADHGSNSGRSGDRPVTTSPPLPSPPVGKRGGETALPGSAPLLPSGRDDRYVSTAYDFDEGLVLFRNASGGTLADVAATRAVQLGVLEATYDPELDVVSAPVDQAAAVRTMLAGGLEAVTP